MEIPVAAWGWNFRRIPAPSPATPSSTAYPEAVLVAVDVQVLYDDLGAVSDLPAAVTAQGLAGPGKNRQGSPLRCSGSGASTGTGFVPVHEQPVPTL